MKSKNVVKGIFLAGGCLLLGGWQAQPGRAQEKAPEEMQTAAKQEEKEQAIYGIGSISKVFTAAAVMQLAEQGKLDLDTPVVQYLPEFVMADERYAAITSRMLLDHSSGLMGSSDHNSMLLGERDPTPHDMFLERLRPQRLKADPGAFSVYSNDSFTLAEILVEKVSGMSFTEYVDRHISSVLGMKDTYTPASVFDRSRQAKGYYQNKNLELPTEYLYEIGAGGIVSTAEDLCLFGQIFTKKGTAVLSPESVKEMETPQTNNPYFSLEGKGGWQYGLGWDMVETAPFDQYGIKAVTKGGDTKVYHGSLTVLPEENISAAVLSSGGSSTMDQLLVKEMLLGVLQLEGKAGEPVQDVLPAVLTDADISSYSGYEGYYISQGGLKVRFQDGILYISTLDKRRNVTQEYLPAEGGVFLSANGDYISSEGELVSAEGGVRGKTVISFKDGENGEKYICAQNSETYPGAGSSSLTLPFGQKVEAQVLSEEVRTAWEAREGKTYYLMDEKPSSSGYLEPATTIYLPTEDSGYFRNARIVDEEHAQGFLEIPMMLGRDLLDYYFYEKEGKQYLDWNNGGEEALCLKKRYISEDSMELLAGESFSVTLEEGEMTRWYTIPQELSGKPISISMPERAAYFVYDSNDRLTDSSIAVNASAAFYLPENGKIAFAGSAGDVFTAPAAQP